MNTKDLQYKVTPLEDMRDFMNFGLIITSNPGLRIYTEFKDAMLNWASRLEKALGSNSMNSELSESYILLEKDIDVLEQECREQGWTFPRNWRLAPD